MSYLVLARKWRPQNFEGLVGQGPIAGILKNAISQNKIAHAYLFSGPRGVGKTSAARILSKALNCKDGPTPLPCGTCSSCASVAEGSSVDVIEIDGASNNSVDDIRDLRERVKYAPAAGKYKVYIIDEAHMLSVSAFNALLKTLEEPPSHVIFVLATTALKKIPATILSRCQHMPFRRISSGEIKTRLTEISEAEGIQISSSALSLISRAAEGSMRDALTILDQLSSFSSEITEENIKSVLGIADLGILTRIARAIIFGDRNEIIETIELISEQGTDIKTFTKELVHFFRNLLVASVLKKPENILELSTEELLTVKDIVSTSSEEQLTLMLSEIVRAEMDVRSSSSPRLAIEMSLIRASFLSSIKPLKQVIENLDKFGRRFSEVKSEAGEINDIGEDGQRGAGESEEDDKPSASITAEGERPEAKPVKNGADSSQDKKWPVKSHGEDIDISNLWEKTLKRIDAPLASKVSQAVVEMKGNELILTLNGGHAVFEDAIRKNLNMLEEVLYEEAGSRFKIKLALLKNKNTSRKKDLKKKILKEPVIREALDLFEGRIVDIIPSAKKER
jgi:DNA polymerase-3 subunit gamma/tau